jgi:5-methyltetrahydrofolate--homocysteine methyltransferase
MGFHRWQSSDLTWLVLKPRVKRLRAEQSGAETLLWQQLRDRRLGGHKFRRQFAIGRFIVDFYCPKTKLVIEVDGKIHESPEAAAADRERDEELHAKGFTVLRIQNDEILENTETVVTRILATLQRQT